MSVTKMMLGCTVFFLLAAPAHAIPVFYQWGGEKISKRIELPDTPAFQMPDGKYIDVGSRYQQVSIFFIPVWNYNKRWCGYIGSDKTYLDLDRKDLSELTEAANLKLSDSPSLPFWDSFGGKILFGLILLLYFGYKAQGKSA